MKYCLTLFLFCSYYFFSTIAYGQQSAVQDPPDAPAVYTLSNNELRIEYNHQLVFLGSVITDGNAFYKDEVSEEKNGLVNQVMNLTSSNGKAITLVGYISGSGEAIPCESDRKDDGFYMVRNSVGLSHSLRNRAIYDRLSDWLLSVDYSANVRIEPTEQSDTMTRFKITISGDEIALRFRPLFYQKHRGLSYFRPWEYKVWQKPIVGWCSWYAYFQNIDETKIHTAADVVSQTLKPYGLQYLQIDDGYQQEPVNFANSWLIPNKKFPHGMDSLAGYIHEKGLKPGIWTYTSFTDKDSALAYKELFVQNDNGEPAYGRWVGYSPDGSRIVFESDRGGQPQLYVMSASGGGAQRISYGEGTYSTPVWSPKGDLIAYTRQANGNFQIGTMKPDGTGERILVDSFHAEGPTFCPNGRVIMFWRDPGGDSGPGLWTVDIWGRNEQQIKMNTYASDPNWGTLRS